MGGPHEPADLRGHAGRSCRPRRRGSGRGRRSGNGRRSDWPGGMLAGAARSGPDRKNARRGKPVGSVHGDSPGVHGCDAANAWRHIVRVSNHRNQMASLIVGAYHTAVKVADKPAILIPMPSIWKRSAALTARPCSSRPKTRSGTTTSSPRRPPILRYGELNFDGGARVRLDAPLCDQRRRLAACGEILPHGRRGIPNDPQVFRGRHLVALARVTASEYGRIAPGYLQARELLGLES